MNALKDWAVVSPKDDSGLGRMGQDAFEVLGLGYHFAVPSDRLPDYSINNINELRLLPDAPEEEFRELLSKVRGILFFENPRWHRDLLRIAHSMKIATVCVPMWEWFRAGDKDWQYCDLFVCPTAFSERILRRYGFTNVTTLPWALDLKKLPSRIIEGPAKIFVHNAGLVDYDDRKGTREAIRAFMRVKNPDIQLIIRIQKEVELPRVDERVHIFFGNITSVTDLYRDGEACIQPSKMEGLGFMVLEAVCSGLPVITTGYPPMNEFVQQKDMLIKTQWFKRKAFASQWVPHAHLKLPQISDLARRIEWAASNDLSRVSRENRQWAEEQFDPERLRRVWESTLTPLLR